MRPRAASPVILAYGCHPIPPFSRRGHRATSATSRRRSSKGEGLYVRLPLDPSALQGWNGEGRIGEFVRPGWPGVVVGALAGMALPLFGIACLWLMFLASNSWKKMLALLLLLGIPWIIEVVTLAMALPPAVAVMDSILK